MHKRARSPEAILILLCSIAPLLTIIECDRIQAIQQTAKNSAAIENSEAPGLRQHQQQQAETSEQTSQPAPLRAASSSRWSTAHGKQNGRARRPSERLPSVSPSSADDNQTHSGGAAESLEPSSQVEEEIRRMLEYRNTPPLFVTPTRDFFVDVARHPLGFKLATMQAIDADGDRIEYSLQPANQRDASPYFAINSTSGELRLAHRKFPTQSVESNETGATTTDERDEQEGTPSPFADSPLKRLYFLNVVANDGKYTTVVELQIHVFSARSAVQLPAEGARSGSSTVAVAERLESLMRSKTSEFFDRLHESGAGRSALGPASDSSLSSPVYPDFVNPSLVRPVEVVESTTPVIAEPDRSSRARAASKPHVGPLAAAIFPPTSDPLATGPTFLTAPMANEQLVVHPLGSGAPHQSHQLLLSVAIVICSFFIIALVLLIFVVPIWLRRRLKTMESTLHRHEQLAHKDSSQAGSSIVCGSSISSERHLHQPGHPGCSLLASPKSLAPSSVSQMPSNSLSQFTLGSASTRGSAYRCGPPFSLSSHPDAPHQQVSRQSSLDSALGARADFGLPMSEAAHCLVSNVVNPVYLHHQRQQLELFSGLPVQQHISRSQPYQQQQVAASDFGPLQQNRQASNNELYYHLEDEHYSTINTESTTLDRRQLPDPSAAASLIGQIDDSRAYHASRCAQLARATREPANEATFLRDSSSPDGSTGSRSSTRSLVRFLSLPARHSAHQQHHQQQSQQYRAKDQNLFSEFDCLSREQQQQHSTKTIARTDKIEREQQVRCRNQAKETKSTENDRLHQWETERFLLEFLDILDEGQFGQVWRCKFRPERGPRAAPSQLLSKSALELELAGRDSAECIVAVKTLKRNAARSERERDELLAEIEIMKLVCEHPNVVRILHCCTRDIGPTRPILLIMEHVELGKLQSFLEKSRLGHHYATSSFGARECDARISSKQPDSDEPPMVMSNEYCDFAAAASRQRPNYHVTSRELIKFIYHIAKGMEYVSSKCIVHRDLASRNILISATRVCKIGDFGMARHMESAGDVYERHSRNSKVPVRWMAPEVLLNNSFTLKSDVFSFGILMWEIVTLGSTPYRHLKTEQIVEAVARNGERPGRPDYCHTLINNLMSECWAKEPQDRPTFKELVRRLDQLLLSSDEYIELDQYPDHDYYNIPAQLAPNELV